MFDQFICGEVRFFLWQEIAVFIFPFAGGCVHSQYKILAGAVTGSLNGAQQILDGFFVALKIRRVAAFVADSGGVPFRFQNRGQFVEHLGAPTKPLVKTGRAYRHDHEFLYIDIIGCVRAAVENVHHRYRKYIGADAAQKPVQGKAQRVCRGPGTGERNRQNRVCAKPGFVRRTVQAKHGRVDRPGMGSVHARQCGAYFGVDIFHSAQHALSAETGGVCIAQLQSFKLSGRSAAGDGSCAADAVLQKDDRLNRGVSPGINNFVSVNALNH